MGSKDTCEYVPHLQFYTSNLPWGDAIPLELSGWENGWKRRHGETRGGTYTLELKYHDTLSHTCNTRTLGGGGGWQVLPWYYLVLYGAVGVAAGTGGTYLGLRNYSHRRMYPRYGVWPPTVPCRDVWLSRPPPTSRKSQRRPVQSSPAQAATLKGGSDAAPPPRRRRQQYRVDTVSSGEMGKMGVPSILPLQATSTTLASYSYEFEFRR